MVAPSVPGPPQPERGAIHTSRDDSVLVLNTWGANGAAMSGLRSDAAGHSSAYREPQLLVQTAVYDGHERLVLHIQRHAVRLDNEVEEHVELCAPTA